MSDSIQASSAGKPGFTRRRFIIGTVGVGAASVIAGTVVRPPRALAATAPERPADHHAAAADHHRARAAAADLGQRPGHGRSPCPGARPARWPSPPRRWPSRPSRSRRGNPGRLIKLPDPTAARRDASATPSAASVSFTDGLNGQTTYFYHVQLTDLRPGTRYYYQVSDGATTPSTAGRLVRDRAHGRAKYRFSSYGDLATPSWDLNASGNIWHESCDNSYYAVTAIENPGDGNGAPLFHLLNGDLCYANLDIFNAPGVWRDFGINVARSAANRPWMPALGNHETEFGTGRTRATPGTRRAGSRRRARRATTGTARTATATT